MTVKTLHSKYKVVHCRSNRPLTPQEFADPVKHDHMQVFLQTAEDWWGTHLGRGQLEDVGLIDSPDPHLYQDNKQTGKKFPTLKEGNIPQTGKNLIMLPCGSNFS